ncbi:hypothetical protein TNCV_3933101 [Trichonephila clavipes]|nr:hypothetical protein TNCV_3933101 [Trichonephila clavipes]
MEQYIFVKTDVAGCTSSIRFISPQCRNMKKSPSSLTPNSRVNGKREREGGTCSKPPCGLITETIFATIECFQGAILFFLFLTMSGKKKPSLEEVLDFLQNLPSKSSYVLTDDSSDEESKTINLLEFSSDFEEDDQNTE